MANGLHWFCAFLCFYILTSGHIKHNECLTPFLSQIHTLTKMSTMYGNSSPVGSCRVGRLAQGHLDTLGGAGFEPATFWLSERASLRESEGPLKTMWSVRETTWMNERERERVRENWIERARSYWVMSWLTCNLWTHQPLLLLDLLFVQSELTPGSWFVALLSSSVEPWTLHQSLTDPAVFLFNQHCQSRSDRRHSVQTQITSSLSWLACSFLIFQTCCMLNNSMQIKGDCRIDWLGVWVLCWYTDWSSLLIFLWCHTPVL